MAGKLYRIALAGNPNCGKTTIFNELTGAHQHVGNYSGVTVERVLGNCRIGGLEVEVIDLPGIYSLSSASAEERVAARELQKGDIDLVLDVLDCSNPQRNLFLTTQLAELGLPLLLVFNMADDAKRQGLKFQYDKLEHFFGAPIVKTVGAQGIGIERLKLIIGRCLRGEIRFPHARFSYGDDADSAIAELTSAVAAKAPELSNPRYFAIKLLEGDPDAGTLSALSSLVPAAGALREKLEAHLEMELDSYFADCRYGIISGACREAIRHETDRRVQISDSLDKVLTNQYLGLPIFLAVMFLVFFLTFFCGQPFCDLVEAFFGALGNAVTDYWPADTLPYLRSLVADGVIGGVGGVLVFLPNILLLFLCIAFLEGTGYMSRAAYVMDGVMHRFGLHGKSFIPMLLGFGCSVPAVMATRTIESERDRLTTILIIPLMSCGARLPIYAMIIPAFFPERFQALTMWAIYLIGVALALGAARLLKSTLFKGGDEVFVMELPPYRMPTFKSLALHMWERTGMYLHKAGTLILAASVILYVINTLPADKGAAERFAALSAEVEKSSLNDLEKKEKIARLDAANRAAQLEHSIAGRIGHGMSTVLTPAGFDWRVSSALIGAFAAKELFVSQLGILFAAGDESNESLQAALRKHYTPLQAFCIMLFCLITMPCLATVAVVRRETNSWGLTLLQMGGLTLLAYLCALLVFQLGSLLKIGTTLLG